MDEEAIECSKRWWFITHVVGGSPLPCLPAAPGAVPDRARLRHLREHGRDGLYDLVVSMAPYALLLQTVVEIVGSSDLRAERVTFGSALDAACGRLGLERRALPPEMEELILRSSFFVITGGGIPGASEAG